MRKRGNSPYTWREYQRKLKRDSRKRYFLRPLPGLFFLGAGTFLAAILVSYAGPKIFAYLLEPKAQVALVQKKEPAPIQPRPITKRDVKRILVDLDRRKLLTDGHGEFYWDGKAYILETSLDMRLQEFTLGLLRRSRTLRAAAVVLVPQTGEVITMADHHPELRGDVNLCLEADYPAASIFKIVSAAAAIEARGFSTERRITFRGRSYTLYRSQLTRESGRYAVETTLRKAFAKSINPVFGKIGVYYLGKELLSDYAGRFLFNQPIPFDLPVGTSHIQVPGDKFGLAEISSGFNKRTLISPLHGALLASAVVNGGVVMEPWLVSRVRELPKNGEGVGRVVYRNSPRPIGKAITEETAKELRVMMEDTVLSGTGRKAFAKIRGRKRFKDIDLGAKTGTVNDRLDRYKYDWTVAYGVPKGGPGGIVVSVLAVHGKLLGVRASELARSIIDYYYRTTRRGI
ncbi:MAG: hypothetical protein JRJ03_09805 [Deltaproteobacteria bacterium]|nr:hypothetical protein [Deltaproteobacteria bacterium]